MSSVSGSCHHRRLSERRELLGDHSLTHIWVAFEVDIKFDFVISELASSLDLVHALLCSVLAFGGCWVFGGATLHRSCARYDIMVLRLLVSNIIHFCSDFFGLGLQRKCKVVLLSLFDALHVYLIKRSPRSNEESFLLEALVPPLVSVLARVSHSMCPYLAGTVLHRIGRMDSRKSIRSSFARVLMDGVD